MVTCISGVKHISLDFWNTIAKPNPAYADARYEYLCKLTGLDDEEVRRIYKQIKDVTEASVMAPTVDAVHKYMRAQFGIDQSIDTRSVFDSLFMQLPPFIDGCLAGQLMRLQETITWSVTSNTNFTSGTLLRGILTRHKLKPDFCIWSDIFGIAKPDAGIFNAVHIVLNHTLKADVKSHEILHIGDHEYCDAGAEAVGFRFKLISGPHELPSLLDRINA